MTKEAIPLNVRLSFAASGTNIGLLSNGISYFLLLYYNQVLGLDPALAGLAMMIALMADAISDPLVGRWSDRLKHPLGRRHPFLFVAILPMPIAYYLLWVPPGLSHTNLFFYMLTLTVALRSAGPMAAWALCRRSYGCLSRLTSTFGSDLSRERVLRL